MIDLVTAAVFVSAAGGAFLILIRTQDWRAAVRRLATEGPARVGKTFPGTTLWRDLVKKVAAAAPQSPRALPQLKRRLLRAGFYHPNAPRYFQAIRVLSAAAGGLAAFVASRAGSASDNFSLAPAAAAAGYWLPARILAMAMRRRQRAIARGLPNALDLMVVCVESGLGVDQTILQVAKELETAHPEICAEFTIMNLELRAGKTRAEALHNLAERTGDEDVRKLVAVLIQTDRFGTSLAQCLRGHAEFLRIMARERAEERAAKVAVKLVFPIFFCVLPSLFVVTIGPVVARMVRELIPMIEKM